MTGSWLVSDWHVASQAEAWVQAGAWCVRRAAASRHWSSASRHQNYVACCVASCRSAGRPLFMRSCRPEATSQCDHCVDRCRPWRHVWTSQPLQREQQTARRRGLSGLQWTRLRSVREARQRVLGGNQLKCCARLWSRETRPSCGGSCAHCRPCLTAIKVNSRAVASMCVVGTGSCFANMQHCR